MPSIYEQAQAFRRRLIERDTAAIEYLTNEYRQMYARLLRALAGVSNQIEEARHSGQTVSRHWLNQQSRYQAFLQQLDREFRFYGDILNQTVMARQFFESAQGRSDATAMIGGSFNRLPITALENAVANLRAESPLAVLLDGFGAVASQHVSTVLRDAILLGKNPRAIAGEIRDALGVPLHRALTIARSEGARAYRQSTLDTYQASEQVTGYIWLASKSRRTCLACLALDGQFFPKDEPQKAHVNCRCTTIATLRDEPPPRRETAGEWFEKQPDAIKREMMGASAFDAMKAGKVQLRDFVGLAKSRKWGDQYYELSLKRVLAGEGKFPNNAMPGN